MSPSHPEVHDEDNCQADENHDAAQNGEAFRDFSEQLFKLLVGNVMPVAHTPSISERPHRMQAYCMVLARGALFRVRYYFRTSIYRIWELQ